MAATGSDMSNLSISVISIFIPANSESAHSTLVSALCISEVVSRLVDLDCSVLLNQGKSLLKKEPEGFSL